MAKRFYSIALTCLMLLVAGVSHATVNVSADPADGSSVLSLSSVTLTFVDEDIVDLGTEAITITSEDGYSATCAPDFGAEMNQMILNFDEITTPGVYTINVPAGGFTVGANVPCEAFTLTYTIASDAQDPRVKFIPADGSTVGYLQNVIYCYEGLTKSVSAVYPNKPAIVKDNTGTVVATGSYAYRAVSLGQCNYDLSNIISTPGTYTIEFEDGTFQYYDGGYVALPGGKATYTVTGEGMDVADSDPNMESDVHSVQTLKVIFPNETVAKASSTYNYVQIYRDGSTYSAGGVSSNGGVADGNTVSYSFYNPLIEPDHYYMTFPAGAFLLGEDERPSSPIQLNFRITSAPVVAYTVTPSESVDQKTLQSFTITFPEKTAVTKVNSTISVSSTVSGFYGGVYTSTTGAYTIDGNSVVCKMNNVATEAGTYTLKVPTNCFTFDDGTFNTEFEIVYNVTGGDDVTMEISPAAGNTYSSLQEFTFSFPGATSVEMTQGLSNDNIIVKQGTNYITTAYQHGTGQGTFEQIDATTWKVTMPIKVVLAGDYTFHIDANVFTVDGNSYNKMTEVEYSVDGSQLDRVTVYPTNLEPITKLAGPITLTYDDETTVTAAESYLSVSLYKQADGVTSTYDQYKTSISNANFSFDGNVVTAQLKDYTGTELEYEEAGVYYIKFGTGSGSTKGIFFLSDGETLATPQHIYWTVDPTATPIKNVENKAGNGFTYNALGQRVADSQKGLVIRDGKKMIKK